MLKRKYIIFVILCVGVLFLSGCSVRLMKAEKKLQEENYEEALLLYQDYLKDHPDAFRARSRMGFACLKTGRIDQSVQEFETVLNTEPGDPYSILYMGLAYLNKENFDQAITVWQQYRNENQPLVEAEINRLMTLLQISRSQKEAEKALAKEDELMAAEPDNNTVAVCYYQDLSPDNSLRAFQKGLAAMVITSLSRVKQIKVVERMQLQALLEELKLGQTAVVDQATAPRVGKLLGAENLIIGSLSPGSIQAATTLTSASTGTIKATITTSVEQEKFYELPGLITGNIVKAMNIELSPEESEAIGLPQTTNYNAFVYFGKALDAVDSGNWKLAKDLFNKAVDEDPMFGMARKGRDSCPEIFLPDIGDLRTNLSGRLENALNTVMSAQMEIDELVKPEPFTGEDPVKKDESDLPEIVNKAETQDVDEIKEVVDEPLKQAPDFPEPPRD